MKPFTTHLIVCLMLIGMVGCGSTEYVPEPVLSDPEPLYHPNVPKKPKPPFGIKIRVLTKERVKEDEVFIGFSYNDWLAFASWQHEKQSYEKSLLEVIESYKKQDKTLKKELQP